MQIGLIFGILILLLIIPDTYIVFGTLENVSWWLRGLLLVPSLAYILLIIRMFVFGKISQKTMNWVMWLTLGIVFPTMLFALISSVGQLLGLIHNSIYTLFNWIALGVAVIWICGTLYGILFGWRSVSVKKLNLHFGDLPKKFNGYKIVHLSDFHIGTYHSSPKTVEEIVSKVNALKSDLIVFTGDLVNNNPDELKPFMGVLKTMEAEDGVVSVLGNHDYCLYREYVPPASPIKETERLIEMEKELGWKVLLNGSEIIKRGEEEIAVVGVENAGGKSFTDRADLQKAVRGLPGNIFKILLSHDPSHWRREVLKYPDIRLTLSGHTHGMQFRIGKFSPAKWAYKEWGGAYREGNQMLVVSTGVGGNVAFRFGLKPQILEIELLN